MINPFARTGDSTRAASCNLTVLCSKEKEKERQGDPNRRIDADPLRFAGRRANGIRLNNCLMRQTISYSAKFNYINYNLSRSECITVTSMQIARGLLPVSRSL